MNVDIGRVVSMTLAMFKERFWPMIGLWAVFVAISIAFVIGFLIVVGTSVAGFASIGPDGFDNPAALGGLGVTVILSMVLFYLLFIAVTFAQQAAMTVMASPVERPTFGEAVSRGFKAGLTFLALAILFIIAYSVVGLIVALIFGVAALAGDIGGAVVSILLVPIGVYFSCRFAVIMPVVAVERVFNPIKAINRTWNVTDGRVIGILVVLLINLAAAVALFAIPLVLLFASGVGAASDPGSLGGPAAVLVFVSILLFFPLVIVYQIVSTTMTACLHAEISDDQATRMSEVFE
ncbi:MAG: hypothetical protein QNI87_09420 [Erythrobacter sp.]|uniref:glycerophosphoryl diester phosphodiesterase membrane domain-containing protein n=1 Tax=Erythrobacter sp. TaxID=1042 RepID=UPI00262F6915|nr:glycerophosphoryl diester phosphodiesterase membrane domain-containing protein [Erythrobacter sp.]MDJ0978745.1 hypothetical protein [Erythrobacter sp.]